MGEFYVLGDEIAPLEVERCREKVRPVVERFARNRDPVLLKALDDTINRRHAGP